MTTALSLAGQAQALAAFVARRTPPSNMKRSAATRIVGVMKPFTIYDEADLRGLARVGDKFDEAMRLLVKQHRVDKHYESARAVYSLPC